MTRIARLRHLLFLWRVRSWPLVSAVINGYNADGSPIRIGVAYPGGERVYMPVPEFVPGPLSAPPAGFTEDSEQGPLSS